MFSSLDLFIVLNNYRISESLSNRLSIPISIPEHQPSQQEPILHLPSSQPSMTTENISCLPTDIQNTVSELSHTIEATETQPDLPFEPNAELTSTKPITEPTLPKPTTQLPDITVEPLDFEAEYESRQMRDEQVLSAHHVLLAFLSQRFPSFCSAEDLTSECSVFFHAAFAYSLPELQQVDLEFLAFSLRRFAAGCSSATSESGFLFS
nr:hypothetical protein Iba_chr10aCG12510 [Ipomoea batatas]